MNEEFSNELENEIINLGTRTALKLIDLGADALTLYTFYCITAKRQSIALHKRIVTIKATENYCLQGLKWGTQRFRSTKKELIKNNLIEAIVKKNEQNQVIGHYIKVKYIPFISTSIETQPLANSTGGEDIPQILLYNNINTDNNIAKSDNSVEASSVGSSSSSRNAILKMTPLEHWQMATELNVPLWVIKEVEDNFWDYIEEPKNRKKYKTTYLTVKRWVKMALDKNKYQHNNEVEVMLLQSQHPDMVAKMRAARAFAEKEKMIE